MKENQGMFWRTAIVVEATSVTGSTQNGFRGYTHPIAQLLVVLTDRTAQPSAERCISLQAEPRGKPGPICMLLL